MGLRRAACGFAALLLPACAFTPLPTPFRTRHRGASSSAQRPQQRLLRSAVEPGSGLNGDGYKFMPAENLSPESPMAMLVAIGGAYPGTSAAEVMAVPALGNSPEGQWGYLFEGSVGPAGATIVVAEGEALRLAVSPVALVSTPKALGLSWAPMPDGSEPEALVLLDRGYLDYKSYEPGKFYAFADPQGALHIRWFEQVPPGWSVVASVMHVVTAHNPALASQNSGWGDDEI